MNKESLNTAAATHPSPQENRLHRSAWIVLSLHALYTIADSLCSVFVGVYFYINSMDLRVVCLHYLTLYAVTPLVFVFAGWYSQARDRAHVFRFGIILNAVYYAVLLVLRERCVDFAVPLGALLGVTWGFYWAGSNTFSYDVSQRVKREYFFGWLSTLTGLSRLVAPLCSALIIQWAPDRHHGYHLVFFAALCVFLVAIVVSLWVPSDRTPRPFHLRRALFPDKKHRDWRCIMIASLSLAGSYSIFHFLLGLVLFMQTDSELSVGAFAAVQALAGIVVANVAGRFIQRQTRRIAMLAGVVILFVAGAMLALKFTLFTLVLFGFMRAIAQPLFSIPHSSLRFEVIDRSVAEASQRIEYLCAWEVPLAIGRIVMMGSLILLFGWLDETGLRIILFLLCANRLLTYFVLSHISSFRGEVRPENA